MKQESINKTKQALIKIKEAIELLELVKNENDDIDACKENLGFTYAEIEYQLNIQ